MIAEQTLDPEIAEALAMLPIKLDGSLSLEENQVNLDAIFEAMAEAMPPPPPNPAVARADHMVPGVEGTPDVMVRIYQPANRQEGISLPALLWIHGGGFFLGNVDGDDLVCEQIVLDVGCVVASVEYRLAPQNPYPAGVEDCYAALEWLTSSADMFHIDLTRVGVGGISAGGCLSAAVSLMARDRQGPQIAFQLLEVPVTDDRLDTSSSKLITDVRVWNYGIALKAWEGYLAGLEGETPVYAAPNRATDLSNLPPAYVMVADQDILRDEGIEYAQRLMRAGVMTELHVFPGTFHGFEIFAPMTSVTQRFVSERMFVLKKALSA